MTDDTEQAVRNSDHADSNNAAISGADDPKQIIQDHARQAIVDAGGNPQLLLPHITSQLGWRQDDDGITVFSAEGEGAESVRALVDQLKANDDFASAFGAADQTKTQPGAQPEAQPPSKQAAQPQPSQSPSKSGSGARASHDLPDRGINSRDPLALGFALREIAAGTTTVNFNV